MGANMQVRRVVTGHTNRGKATVVSDSNVEGTTAPPFPGFEQHTIWGADAPPNFPDAGSMPPFTQYFPSVGGFRFTVVTFQPESNVRLADVDRESGVKELERIWPGLAAAQESDNPRMHVSDTVDFEYIISGEIWLELDDGNEVYLKAGDTVVQNGTRHAWHNRSEAPCRMVVCLIGAQRSHGSKS